MADAWAQAQFNADLAAANQDMQYARMADDIARAQFSAARSLEQDALNRRLQEQSRTDRLGDVRFNRQLALSQEAREAERQKLARERFETEKKLSQDELDFDKRVSGAEGQLLMQQFDSAQRREKEIADALKRLDAQLKFQTDTATKRGYQQGRDSLFTPSAMQGMDPDARRGAAMINQNIASLLAEAQPLSEEMKRVRKLQDETRARAARMQTYITPEGMVSARGQVYPFPSPVVVAAPAPAPAPAPSRTKVVRDPVTGEFVEVRE